jgi:hypothetical protein
LLAHILGLDSGSGRWYLFWSGIGSDLAYLAVFGALWHHLNCHEPGCWRLARHRMNGRCARHGGRVT